MPALILPQAITISTSAAKVQQLLAASPTPSESAIHRTATYVAGIFGQSVDPAGASVSVDSDGKLGTVLSSRRFKDGIKPMDQASEVILELKPVTFHYKSDKKNTPCFGLIAEDVAAVNPDLVVRDKNGEILSVRYEQVNAMLLNEFLKEHRTVQDLKSAVAKQEALIAQQQEGMAILDSATERASSANPES